MDRDNGFCNIKWNMNETIFSKEIFHRWPSTVTKVQNTTQKPRNASAVPRIARLADARGSLARSRKRAVRIARECVCARESSGFSRSYIYERLSDDRRVSDESLSFSRLGGLSLAHNKHGSKSPADETRTGERRGPENVRLSTGAKHDQTHASRPAASDVCASRRPVES